MDNLFIESIQKSNILENNKKFTLAVSGGADSMYLFYNFVELKKIQNLDILVCHLNHDVRDTATRDENFVKSKCAEFEIKCVTKTENMNEFAQENKISKEEAGRILRYRFFRQYSKDRIIVTAHNANDRAETLLFRLIRGTGINGLVGIKEFRDGIYRPMLSISRDNIEKYLRDNNLEYIEDETNYEEIYTRNKIRLSLIPELENYNPNIINALLRLSDNAKDAMNFIDDSVKSNFDKIIINGVICIEELNKVHEYLAKEIIKRLLEQKYGKGQIISRDNILKIYELKNFQSGKKIDLGNSIIARKSFDKIIFEKKKISTEKSEKFPLEIGNNRNSFGEFKLKITDKKADTHRFNIMLDYDKIKGSLILRTRINGDRFKPLGMKGEKKLKDYFIDRKVDVNKRDNIALICDEEKILWVVGMDISEDAKIDNSTKKILHLEAKNDRY